MIQVLYSYCLITTEVRILCTNQCGKNNKTTIVSTESHSLLKDNISSIFGCKQVANLLEIQQRMPNENVLSEYGISEQENKKFFKLEGYISSCAHGKGRSANDRQFYFINNRPCDPAKIARVVNEVYHHYNKHQYPMIVLNIRMEDEDVDINVTPDKRQIMISREKLLIATIKTTLICLYENIPSTLNTQNLALPRLGSPRIVLSANSPSGISPSPRISTLLSRFSRSPASPLSNQSPLAATMTGASTFGGIKRAFLQHSEFQAAKKQPKLHDFSFKVIDDESGLPKLGTENISPNDSEKEVQDDLSDITPLPRSPGISPADDLEELSQFDCSNHLNGLKGEIDNSVKSILQVCDEGKKEICTSPITESHNLPKEIHGRTEAFLSSLKKKKVNIPSNYRKLKDSATDSGSDSVTETLTVDNSSTIATDSGSDSVTETLTVDNSSTIASEHTFDVDEAYSSSPVVDPSNTTFCNDSVIEITDEPTPVSQRKSLTVSVSTKIIRDKLRSRNKNVEKNLENMYRKFRAQISPLDNQTAEDELKKEISKESFAKMEILGQFNLGFLITRFHSDLFIVDQHATDEKYNYETLQKTCILQNQKLIVPQTLELTVANESVLVDNMDIFTKNGFEFRIDDEKEAGRRVMLTSMPHSKGWEFKKEDIEEMIFMLSDSPGVMCRPSRVNMMFASRACRKSVMIGTHLNPSQMRKLIDHMGEIEQPWNCPHGRPTIRHLINLDILEQK